MSGGHYLSCDNRESITTAIAGQYNERHGPSAQKDPATVLLSPCAGFLFSVIA